MQPRLTRLSAALGLGIVLVLVGCPAARGALVPQLYVTAPTATNLKVFVTYEGPYQASAVDSETAVVMGKALKNDFWSFKVEEIDLDNDNAFDDIRITVTHKGYIKDNDFVNDSGPALEIIYKDVKFNNPPVNDVKDKEGDHKDGKDMLQTDWFYTMGNNFSELSINDSHAVNTSFPGPDVVPEPSSLLLCLTAGVGLLVYRKARREKAA
jgi:hypothetical protein